VVAPGIVSDIGGQLVNTDHADVIELDRDFGLALFNRDEDAARFPFPPPELYFNGRRCSET
jgi:monoamine oxidase